MRRPGKGPSNLLTSTEGFAGAHLKEGMWRSTMSNTFDAPKSFALFQLVAKYRKGDRIPFASGTGDEKKGTWRGRGPRVSDVTLGQ